MKKTNKITIKEFINNARIKHENKYDYSLVKYEKSNKKVKIVCPEHGIFEQRPSNHLNGNGCPSCARHGFDNNKSAIFYILKIKDVDVWKIGITNKTVEQRYNKHDKNLFDIVKIIEFENGKDAFDLETKLKIKFKKCKYIGEPILEGCGISELFNLRMY